MSDSTDNSSDKAEHPSASPGLLDRVALPVASIADAEATCRTALPYLAGACKQVTAIHVVQRTSGAPEDAELEVAQDALDIVRGEASKFGIDIAAYIVSSEDIPEAIVEAARDVHATAIVYTPRQRQWWHRLIAGNLSQALQSRSSMPIILIPRRTDRE